jgi:DNA-binding Lrp family transcriptional regulator
MLDAKKFTGPNAGSMKYDLLTALSVVGLAGSPAFQTSMTRLIALVTSRYNWQMDQLSIGQRDMARMWSVDERTVKREIKRLVESGILKKIRQGVRGRVGAYRIDYHAVWRMSEPIWANVGPDFDERMKINSPRADVKVVKLELARGHKDSQEQPTKREGVWRDVRQRLKMNDEAIYKNWLSKLVFEEYEEGYLKLLAPTQFVARYIETNLCDVLFREAKGTYPSLSKICIQSG